MNRTKRRRRQYSSTRSIDIPPLLTKLTISDLKKADSNVQEQEYTFVKPLPHKYLCGICKSLLTEPHATECCGQHFCKECLEKSRKESKLCPNCRQSDFNHIKYLPIEREINNLKVSCPRKSSGCNVEVDYADRKKHDKECEFVRIPCTNKCKQHIFKKDMESHIKNHCELRETTCKTCGKVGEYKEIGSFAHHFLCPDVIQSCPNSCGEQFKRRDTELHNSLCSEAIVTCDFAETGCLATLKRKDLDSHFETNMKQHLSLLMTAYIALKQEHEIIIEENMALKQKNASVKDETKQTRIKLKRTQEEEFDSIRVIKKAISKSNKKSDTEHSNYI